MKKLILLLLFIPLVSFGQVINEEVKTYYESGELETIVNIVDGLKFYAVMDEVISCIQVAGGRSLNLSVTVFSSIVETEY